MSDVPSHDLHTPKAHAPETEQFDREINVRGIVISGVALVVVCLVAALLMWWLLKGFEHYDEKRDVRLSPVELAHPQQPPPSPLLQSDPVTDMTEMRVREDRELNQAAWIDRQQGTLRLPVADAIDIVAARGVAPEVVGGRTGGSIAAAPVGAPLAQAQEKKTP
ncbi:MAG TPA: hypothetical protein VGS07_34470 [Thermoanaerobaculia bacterium]|jgi:hypothetical protein|nr:hypothetical protein [Thermoanaerobaculia bacterium]